MGKLRLIPLGILALTGGLMASHPDEAMAQGSKGRLLLEVPISSVEVRTEKAPQNGYDLELVITNPGEVRIEANVRIEGPKDWGASLYHQEKTANVGSISIEPGSSIKNLSFHFLTPVTTENGTYTFGLRFLDDTDARLGQTEFTVLVDIARVEGIEEARVVSQGLTGGFEFDARFSYLTGRVGEPITFRANLKSREPRPLSFVLDADVPLGWKVAYKPTFQDAQFGTIAVRPGAVASLDVVVTPPPSATPGVHPVVLRASPGGIDPIEVPLQVELTGVPDLNLATESGQLTAEATAGEATDLKVFVVNSGDGSTDNVHFVSVAPPEWTVTLDQNPVRLVEAGETVELTVSVRPPEKTVPGDYDVRLVTTVDGKATDLVFSIVVVRSTVFGVLGMALIGVVVLGLGGLFVGLSRR